MKLSIISCARAKGDSTAMYQSIVKNGIGSMYLLENMEQVDTESMADGYNKGIERSTGEVLVFTHGDVRFWAGLELWMEAVKKLYEDKTGFIGVAGATRYSIGRDTMAWWTDKSALSGFAAHRDDGKTYMSSFGPIGPVMVLDGVFLACRRTVIEKIGPFTREFKWDFYDIDITLRAYLAGFVNHTVALPLVHFSIGRMRDDWTRCAELMMKKYELLSKAGWTGV